MTPTKTLSQILLEMELVSKPQLLEALAVRRDKGGALGRILIDLEYVSEKGMLRALAAQVGMELTDLGDLGPMGQAPK